MGGKSISTARSLAASSGPGNRHALQRSEAWPSGCAAESGRTTMMGRDVDIQRCVQCRNRRRKQGEGFKMTHQMQHES